MKALVTTLGALDGFTLGTYDGIELGFTEGSTEGTVDDNLEGLFLGALLGAIDRRSRCGSTVMTGVVWILNEGQGLSWIYHHMSRRRASRVSLV